MEATDRRIFVCGTRVVLERGPQNYRVVCATCHEGGKFRHITEDLAASACIRDSARSCRACGAS